ncbi:hypothetical protein R80B4_02721 [Fibrobacteres bacterium R8-0-B4]
MDKIALDTNVLIYNHGLDGNPKRLISEKFFRENPVISPQVVSEYINVMQRFFKVEKNELIEMCAKWLKMCTIQPIVFSTIARAQYLIKKYDFQIFDGIIVASALEAGCGILYSADMQHGLVVDGALKIVNPYLS